MKFSLNANSIEVPQRKPLSHLLDDNEPFQNIQNVQNPILSPIFAYDSIQMVDGASHICLIFIQVKAILSPIFAYDSIQIIDGASHICLIFIQVKAIFTKR